MLSTGNENKNQEIAIITALTQKEASDAFVYNFYDGAKFLSDTLGSRKSLHRNDKRIEFSTKDKTIKKDRTIKNKKFLATMFFLSR